jgi:ribosomal protein S12 methylthiotransferase
MKRAISGEDTKELLHKIRKEIPDATFRTSIIVGFPGETEDEFQELMDFVKEFRFDYIGVFKYSREEDTVAYHMEDQVDEETKHRRWVELTNLQAEIAESKNKEFLGKEIEVMIDGISDESEFMLEGRTRGQALEIDGKVLTNDGTGKPGEIVKVRVEQNFNYDLLGPIIENNVE